MNTFKKLIENNLFIELTIIGSGPLKNSIKLWLKENQLSEHVKLIDKLSRKEIAVALHDKCDIFVHPSKSETFGMVVLEALACGKPVVCTKCGGPEDFIKDGINGFLCENNSVRDFINKIQLCIEKYDIFKSDNIVSSIEKYDYDNLSFDILNKYKNRLLK